jgi:prepilin-type N-terminal cleavage/methylation domain-containing protein
MKRGFTLIELLVAMVVLAMLGVLITQVVMGASQATSEQTRRMDSLSEGRFVLDRFGLDWLARSRRDDLPVVATPRAGNDRLAFVTQVMAYSGTRPFAVVEYAPSVESSALARASLGYNWTENDPRPDNNPLLTFPVPVLPTPLPSDFEVLSPGVFRWEFTFIRKSDGQITLDPSASPSGEDFGGILMVIAVMDEKNRQLVTDDALRDVAACLPDAVSGPTTESPLSAWQRVIEGPSPLDALNLPQSARRGIRVFQRAFYLE